MGQSALRRRRHRRSHRSLSFVASPIARTLSGIPACGLPFATDGSSTYVALYDAYHSTVRAPALGVLPSHYRDGFVACATRACRVRTIAALYCLHHTGYAAAAHTHSDTRTRHTRCLRSAFRLRTVGAPRFARRDNYSPRCGVEGDLIASPTSISGSGA